MHLDFHVKQNKNNGKILKYIFQIWLNFRTIVQNIPFSYFSSIGIHKITFFFYHMDNPEIGKLKVVVELGGVICISIWPIKLGLNAFKIHRAKCQCFVNHIPFSDWTLWPCSISNIVFKLFQEMLNWIHLSHIHRSLKYCFFKQV